MSPIYLKYVRKLLYLGAHIFGGTHFFRRKMKSRSIFLEQQEEKKVKINIPGAISLDPNHLATAQITPFFRRVDRRHRHCGSAFSSHLCQGNFFLLFLKGGRGVGCFPLSMHFYGQAFWRFSLIRSQAIFVCCHLLLLLFWKFWKDSYPPSVDDNYQDHG